MQVFWATAGCYAMAIAFSLFLPCAAQWSTLALLDVCLLSTVQLPVGGATVFATGTGGLFNTICVTRNTTGTEPFAFHSFAEVDAAFSVVQDWSGVNGLTATGGMDMTPSPRITNAYFDVSLGCYTTAASGAKCVAQIASTPSSCWLDYGQSFVDLALIDPLSSVANLIDWLEQGIQSRGLLRRWIVASLDYTRDMASVVRVVDQALSSSDVSVSEAQEVLQVACREAAAATARHVTDVLSPKWAFLQSLLSNTTPTADCPVLFVGSWIQVNAASVGYSVAEAAVSTALTNLLSASSVRRHALQSQCVALTYVVARMFEEDIHAFAAASQQASSGSLSNGCTLVALSLLPAPNLAAGHARLAQLISTALSPSTLLTSFRVSASPARQADMSEETAACVGYWFGNVTAITFPDPQWLQSAESTGVLRCYSTVDLLLVTANADSDASVRNSSSTSSVLEIFDFVNANNAVNSVATDALQSVSLWTVASPTVLQPNQTMLLFFAKHSPLDLSLGVPLGFPGSSTFTSVVPPAAAQRIVPITAASAFPAPQVVITNPAVDGAPAPLCGIGWQLFKHYETNQTICQQCVNADPDYMYCLGDGYARACANKPILNASYVAQGLAWSSPQCPFQCLDPHQYRANFSRCVTAEIGHYPTDNASLPCTLPTPVAAAFRFGADAESLAAFLTAGLADNPGSCGFSLKRVMLSPVGHVPGSLMWCDRSTSNARGIRVSVKLRLSPSSVLDAHTFEASTRVGYQLVQVGVPQGQQQQESGWSFYLVSTVDRLGSSFTPTAVSFQLWFNASFLEFCGPMATADASTPRPPMLFFSKNVTLGWKAFASTSVWATDVGVSIDFDASTLAFVWDQWLLGPVYSFPWTRSWATAPCPAPKFARSNMSWSLGGWLAKYKSSPPTVMTSFGVNDQLCATFQFVPGNITRVVFAPFPFGADDLLGGRSADSTAVHPPPLFQPATVGMQPGMSSTWIDASRVNVAPDEALHFLTAVVNRSVATRFLQNLSAVYNQSSIAWGGTCRSGFTQVTTSTTAAPTSGSLAARCIPCPVGSLWTQRAVTGGASADLACPCASTRAFLRNASGVYCLPLRAPFPPPVLLFSAPTFTQEVLLIPLDGSVVTTLAVFALEAAVTGSRADPGLPTAMASIDLAWQCDSLATKLFVAPLTNGSRMAVCVNFSLGFAGETCTVTATTTQPYRFPSAKSTITFALVPKVLAVNLSTLSVRRNTTVLEDSTPNVTISVHNYTFVTERMSSFVNEFSPLLDTTLVTLAAAVNSSMFVARVWEGLCGRVAGSPLAAYQSPTGTVTILTPASAGQPWYGLCVRLSVTSVGQQFAESDSVSLQFLSQSFAESQLTPQANVPAQRLAHPAVFVVSALVLFVSSVALGWTFYRRPDSDFSDDSVEGSASDKSTSSNCSSPSTASCSSGSKGERSRSCAPSSVSRVMKTRNDRGQQDRASKESPKTLSVAAGAEKRQGFQCPAPHDAATASVNSVSFAAERCDEEDGSPSNYDIGVEDEPSFGVHSRFLHDSSAGLGSVGAEVHTWQRARVSSRSSTR